MFLPVFLIVRIGLGIDMSKLLEHPPPALKHANKTGMVPFPSARVQVADEEGVCFRFPSITKPDPATTTCQQRIDVVMSLRGPDLRDLMRPVLKRAHGPLVPSARLAKDPNTVEDLVERLDLLIEG
jgi:hypothetical protein